MTDDLSERVEELDSDLFSLKSDLDTLQRSHDDLTRILRIVEARLFNVADAVTTLHPDSGLKVIGEPCFPRNARARSRRDAEEDPE